jgi:hypothetical protein
MTRIGVTGHMDLATSTVRLVREAIRKTLVPHVPDGLTGVSCIAVGADSIFAEVVLDLGGTLEVILPASDYRRRKVKPEHADRFDSLVDRASSVRVMPYEVSNRDAYEAANEALVASSDRLIAVWDGRAPADKGGTAAVVHYAESRGIPVEIVWPDGAERM